jgi:hypothetical protein
LTVMAKARLRADWERTSLLAAIGANPHRDPKKRKKPYDPAEFNPFAAEGKPAKKKPKIKISVDCLRALCE